MPTLRWSSVFAVAALFAFALGAGAQVTTGAIGGTVVDETLKPIANAQVQIVNTATGFRSGALTRDNGRFLVPNLDVGAGYDIIVRRIGFSPLTRSGLVVTLGQTSPADFVLRAQAAQLSEVRIVEDVANVFTSSRKGAETSINDSLLKRLPSLSRDVASMVKFAPQVNVNTGGGPSAGGAYNRYNNYMIDGANQNDKFSLSASNGVPGGASNGRVISLEAVKEYQILMTPADVRQGNFAGMAVNMVTKNGTNTFTGGGTYTYRDPRLASPEEFIKNGKLKVAQYGFYVGGPIIKDKLHFFVAPEFQARSSPASGAYTGAAVTEPGLIFADSIARIISIMKTKGADIGTGGQVSVENPLTNLSLRLDFQANEDHRMVFRQLYNTAKNTSFSRNTSTFQTATNTQNSGFRLTSNMFTGQNTNQSSTFQLYSVLPKSWTNEFFTGYNTIEDRRILPGTTPLPEISLPVTRVAGGTQAVTFGTEQFSPANAARQKILEIMNNLTVPLGNHNLLFGARYERTSVYNNYPQQSYGVFKFNSIADLEAARPLNYAIGYVNGGNGEADFRVQEASVYGQDQWEVTSRLSVTYGLRLDAPSFIDKPARNDSVIAQFTRAGLAPVYTDAVPKTQLLWSPRFGFNWNAIGDRATQLRGTVGVFTAPPPYVYIGNAFQGTGLGFVTLGCTGTDTPAFTMDVNNLPRSCAGKPAPLPGLAGTAGIAATDPNFKYPQYKVGSLGFDQKLPWGMVFTFDAIYRSALNGMMVVEKNLKGPRMVNGTPYTDRNGRVLYADTISASGTVTNDGQKVIKTIGSPAVSFTEGIIYLTNQKRDYNYTLTGALRKRFGSDLDVNVSYTYMQAKDVQSMTSDRSVSTWRNGRSQTGLDTDQTPTTSVFERPHRIVFFGSWTMPWKSTDLTWSYEAQSGSPITYQTTADLNGNGTNADDPIYIPRNAADTTEFRFANITSGATVTYTAAAQAKAFNDFITTNGCLDKQRGQIMARNSCNTQWQNRMDVSFRQRFPAAWGQRVTVQLDIFNFANLINRSWGQIPFAALSSFPQQNILLNAGRTAGPLNQSLPIFTFDPRVMASTSYASSYNGAFYRSQTSLSNFYTMQLTMRYSF